MSRTKDINVRQRIINESIKLFLKNGFRGTSVNIITKAAGIAKGTLYCHFVDKEELLETVVDKFDKEFYDVAIEKVTATEGGFLVKFNTLYRFITKFAKDNRELLAVFNTLEGEIVGNQSNCEIKMKAIQMKFHRFLKRLLDDGKTEGAVQSETDTDSEAHIILGTFIGMHLYWYMHETAINPIVYTKRLRESILKNICV